VRRLRRLPSVSVLTPLTEERRAFAPSLYRNFARSSYPAELLELVVLDQGFEPSLYLQALARMDPRVRVVLQGERPPVLSEARRAAMRARNRTAPLRARVSTGRARNTLLQSAMGEVVVYMDSDDFYGAG
jgi:hypothetical protein